MTIKFLQKHFIKFRDERNWKQFHKPKDVAISLALEAAEVLEHFQWKTDEEIKKYLKSKKLKDLQDEAADVLIYLLLLANELGIDLEEAYFEKMKENEKRYTVEKAKGKKEKYTEYE